MNNKTKIAIGIITFLNINLSTLGFAKQNAADNLNISEISEQADAHYKLSISTIESNLRASKAAYDILLAQFEQIPQVISNPNDKMSKILTACSNSFKEKLNYEFKTFSMNQEQMIKDVNLDYKKIKQVIKSLGENNCESCPDDLKKSIYNQYSEQIDNIKYNMTYAARDYSIDDQIKWAKSKYACNFNSMFKFEDEPSLIEYKGNSLVSFSAILSYDEILKTEYNSILQYVSDHSPIRVLGSLSRFSSAKSEHLDDGTILVNVEYSNDILMGKTYSYPMYTNPFEIIRFKHSSKQY